ncbi:hypothetical protein [Blastococcus brunescens]|uniref:Secreted protein n=1 Tax=Blastococcus brunescens TaxID=1564165 RepID=A0ABZ1AZV5_9ACTN|nr:hypothetical protein [Blastococcus sp. BMG 8361]WRL64087.1 hypothetical protein U6N30_31660 [Blastococcus sp. BMG 8361]
MVQGRAERRDALLLLLGGGQVPTAQFPATSSRCSASCSRTRSICRRACVSCSGGNSRVVISTPITPPNSTSPA